ncbi:hypothetical protein D9M68_696990 [compost metagenome]
MAVFGQGARIGFADAFNRQQGLRRDRQALRVAVPFVEAAHGGHGQARIGGHLLEIQRGPAFQRALDRRARCAVAGRTAQQRERAIAMVSEIGMDPDPAAIAATVQAGDGIPGVGRNAVDLEVAAAFLRRVQHVDAYLLPGAAAQVPDLGGGQGGRGHAGLRRRADGKRRGKDRVRACQHDMAQ